MREAILDRPRRLDDSEFFGGAGIGLTKTEPYSDHPVYNNFFIYQFRSSGENRPNYRPGSEGLKPYVDSVIERLKGFFADKVDYINSIDWSKLTIGYGRLPENVLGKYETGVADVTIGEDVADDDKEAVVGHEITHFVHDQIEGIGKAISKYGTEKARAYIEGAASYISKLLWGGRDGYDRWSQKFGELVGRIGIRDAVNADNLPTTFETRSDRSYKLNIDLSD